VTTPSRQLYGQFDNQAIVRMCDSSTYACNEVEKTLEQNRTYVYFDKKHTYTVRGHNS